jgi:hypothetical protein
MLIQINTDDNVNHSDTLTERIEATVRDVLDRFADQVTRVEVHLSDENSDKKSGGPTCAACWKPGSQASSP